MVAAGGLILFGGTLLGKKGFYTLGRLDPLRGNAFSVEAFFFYSWAWMLRMTELWECGLDPLRGNAIVFMVLAGGSILFGGTPLGDGSTSICWDCLILLGGTQFRLKFFLSFFSKCSCCIENELAVGVDSFRGISPVPNSWLGWGLDSTSIGEASLGVPWRGWFDLSRGNAVLVSGALSMRPWIFERTSEMWIVLDWRKKGGEKCSRLGA